MSVLCVDAVGFIIKIRRDTQWTFSENTRNVGYFSAAFLHDYEFFRRFRKCLN